MAERKGEFALIDWIRSRLGEQPGVAIPSGDDMAGLDLAGDGLVLVTTDMLLDGVHFDSGDATLAQIGYKSLACSLSDAAAMASLPRGAVVSVALPREWDMALARDLVLGLLEAANRYDCPLVGGDITSWSHPLSVSVTVMATESGVPAVRRSGAQAGDAILVTGKLGGSLVSGRHLSFEPRVEEARKLATAVRLHAMIDLSDGLSSDLNHICDESGVGCEIDAVRVPVSEAAARNDPGRWGIDSALHGGEDFELCFTCSPLDARRLLDDPPVDVPLTQIGRVTAGPERTILYPDGRREPLTPMGYEHFR